MAVIIDKNKIVIRFRVKGYDKQFYLSTGLDATKKNKIIVDARWELISRDIALDEFDPTLERYKFGVKKKNEQKIYTFLELWDKFITFKEQIIEPSTLYNYQVISRTITNLPTEPPELRNYLLKNYSYPRAKKILETISQCLDWAVTSGLIQENKLKALKLPTKKKPSTETIAAYTLQQRDLIIYTFENHYKFSHYTNLIKFLFWTGCRPGEAFALTWQDINQDCTKIIINKSYASRERLTKSTKNNKSRTFPASPGGKLQSLLATMRQCRTRDLVFYGLSGQKMNLRILDKVWRGHLVAKRFYPGVTRKMADDGLVPYLKVYSTRHTFATWAIATGSTPDKVAYWLGDNVQTVLAFYCHPAVSKADCPDF